MAHVIQAEWVVTPQRPPEVWLHCGSCRTIRAFRSSGRIRLNANRKQLDAWLIYRCGKCDRTWNRPIIERASVHDLSSARIEAMQQSTPSWVRDVEFDLAGLKRHSDQIVIPPEVVVSKQTRIEPAEDCTKLLLHLRVPRPSGVRLDRLLASELGLSRTRLQYMLGSGFISINASSRNALKRPLHEDLLIWFMTDTMPREDRNAILFRMFS